MKQVKLSLTILFISLIALVTAGTAAFLYRENPLIWQVAGGIALVGFIFYLYGERAFYTEMSKKRTARLGLMSLVMSVFGAGILVFVNMIANEYDLKKDFTKNQLNSLSEQSQKIVKELKSDVTLLAFINPMQQAEYKKVFDKYTYFSKNLKTEYVDADKDPMIAQEYKVTRYPVIIVKSEARTSRVENIMDPNDPKIEEKITNAVISVTKGDKKKIYFVTGHGEHLVSDSQPEGFTEVKENLEASRYQVEELALASATEIPVEAEIVVVPGPKTEFLPHEMKAVENYMAKGGKVLFMIEPTSSAKFQPFLQKYGVDWKPNKAVVETNPMVQLSGGNALTPIVTKYDSHEITRNMKAQTPTIFPVVAPVEKMENAPGGYKVTNLFSTSGQSLVGDLKNKRLQADPKTARKGPVPVAVAVTGSIGSATDQAATPSPSPQPEAKKNEFRLVVVGDSDFVANQIRSRYFNSDLFENMLSWLSHEEDLISIRPRSTDTSYFDITEQRARQIVLASVIFSPLMLFAAGFGIWFSRRRR